MAAALALVCSSSATADTLVLYDVLDHAGSFIARRKVT
jgi:hypothetical protein